MKDGVRARYTLDFKQETVRLVRGRETLALAARTLALAVRTLALAVRTLAVFAQSLDNWVKQRLQVVSGTFGAWI